MEDMTVLELMENERVFSVHKKKNGTFLFLERCDDFFSVSLTQEQVLQLSEELRSLATGPQEGP